MTDYEKAVIENIKMQILLTEKSAAQARAECNYQWERQMLRNVDKLYRELREYQELFHISHLDVCVDLDGRVLPSKAEILKEVEEDGTTKSIYTQPD